MTHYKLLIIGHTDPRAWDEVYGSMQMLTYGLTTAFGELPHVHLTVCHVAEAVRRTPKADIVLCVVYNDSLFNAKALLRDSGARKLAAIAECPMPCEHTFLLQGALRYPACKALWEKYTQPNKANVILLDHTWHSDDDRTAEIEGWLNTEEFFGRVWRMTRPGSETHEVPGWVGSIPYSRYVAYLKATQAFSRFIVTHKESYGFAVPEMAARGIQVLSPRGYLPDYMVQDFGVIEFDDREGLLNVLRAPVGVEWQDKMDVCTDYQEMAAVLDARFQEWLTSEAR